MASVDGFGLAQPLDSGGVEAEVEEHGLGVFAQVGGRAWTDLLFLLQPDGAVDGQVRLVAAVVDRYEHPVGEELRVVGALFERLDDSVREARGVEHVAPLG